MARRWRRLAADIVPTMITTRHAAVAVVATLFMSVALTVVAPPPAYALAWVLALPPSKEAAAPDHDPRRVIRKGVDREAPITAWRRGPSYDSGEACEDARLQAIQDFDRAAEALDDREPSADEWRRLRALGEHAFGRCVPSSAFVGGPQQPSPRS
jgi:hypothetical protein